MKIWIEKNSKLAKNICSTGRSGLYLRFEKNVDPKIKQHCKEFGQWLRENYCFPTRVTIYFKSRYYIQAMDGENVSATFFGPFNKEDTPYIRIATGDYDDMVRENGEFNARCAIFSSMVHELTHYYQWLRDTDLTEDGEERQAKYYSRKIVYQYLNTLT